MVQSLFSSLLSVLPCYTDSDNERTSFVIRRIRTKAWRKVRTKSCKRDKKLSEEKNNNCGNGSYQPSGLVLDTVFFHLKRVRDQKNLENSFLGEGF